nr:hypothetical protein GCM10020063_037670 [Dactylosporangium thailandense]
MSPGTAGGPTHTSGSGLRSTTVFLAGLAYDVGRVPAAIDRLPHRARRRGLLQHGQRSGRAGRRFYRSTVDHHLLRGIT